VVVVRARYPRSYYYGRYYYSPFYYSGWYQRGPYGYPYPPYGYRYRVDELTTSVRLQVSPREAEVFVDGYFAGEVDDFDGIFQRLRLTPGAHEIVIYREGYRTIRESLYFSPGADRKIERTMVPLGPGETSEPPPDPAEVELSNEPGAYPPPAASPEGRAPAAEPPVARERADRFGTLELRIQPADAEVLVDGERWDAPAGSDRISIQLAEGRHRVEVRKAGFNVYAEDVLIRRGATLRLNVSLTGGVS
jgi:hypothetical protein